jgi:hypothetical protein
MADQDELARARFLREKQEYLDARLAYEEALNNAAMRMPIPSVAKASYNASDGPQRAATDPWIAQSHPDLKSAASRLLNEERQYLALDEPVSNHAQKNCSIVQYTKEKFYEYAALGEMLYKLATDSTFRNDIAAKLGTSITESGGFFNDLGIIMSMSGNGPRAIAGAVSKQAAENNRRMSDAQMAASKRMVDRISSYFSEKWAAFKKGWEECGLAHAVARAGVDGVFLAGEIVIGGAALKGFRFAYSFSKGLHKVDIISIEKGRIGGHAWSTEALEGKYGKPNQNQVAGVLTDKNRNLPDTPAEKPPAKAKTEKDEAGNAAKRTRSREELLPDGKVPEGKDFAPWWNDLSPAEHDLLWQDKRTQNTIRSRVLGGGGTHEWLKRSQLNKLKELGFSMEEIKAFTSPTRKTEGPNPINGERWRHTNEDGTTGKGSGDMHKALDKLFEDVKDRNELLRRYGYWANSWLDGGIDSLPSALRDAILRAGGG